MGWRNSPRSLADAKSRGVGATLGTPSLGLAALIFQASKPTGFHNADPNFPLCVPRVCAAKRRPFPASPGVEPAAGEGF